MKIVTTCFVSLLTLAVQSASALNYYVDPSSWGLNTGTFSDPWKSLKDIPADINHFQPGDTVFFKRGQEYYGTLSINSTGQYGAPIVFMPYGSGNAPRFQYAPINPNEFTTASKAIIRLNQVNNIVIDGFQLTDASIPDYVHSVNANVGYGVYIYGGPNGNGNYNIIKNLTISHVGVGVMVDGGSYNTITGCNLSNMHMIVNTPFIMWDDTGAIGITLSGSNNTVSNNTFQHCWGFSFDYLYDGGAIEMYGDKINSNNILYNTAIDNLGFMEFGSGSGGQAYSNLVAYNLLINNGDVFWINSGNGFNIDVQNLQLYNNNIVETGFPRLPDVTSLIGIASASYIPNVISMKNNIFWLARYINVTDPRLQPFNGPQLIHQNNLYHLTGGSLGFNQDPSEMSLKPTDTLFSNMTSSSDPAFWSYYLRQSSAAINFGQNIGITKDFYGEPVPSSYAPDAGIAEHIILSDARSSTMSVEGQSTPAGNNVEWTSSVNSNVSSYEVEKSDGGINFKTIAVVSNKQAADSTRANFQILDNDVKDGTQYYRIKLIGRDSTSTAYSKVISITNGKTDNLVAFPNPAIGDLYLKIANGDFLNKDIALINMAGMEVSKSKFNDANSQVKINVSTLPPGVYVVNVIDHISGKEYKTRFTKAK